MSPITSHRTTTAAAILLLSAPPLLLLLATGAQAAATTPGTTTYPSLASYAGSNFFDGFTFSGGYDNTTNGDVFWVTNSSLAYVDSTSNQAIIRVDNTTTLPYNEKRNSVKLFSKNWYQPGVVLVMDIAHLPVGCSVWPAFWTQGTNWPNNGEIDILETINDQTYSQFSLHTNSSSGSCTATTNSTLGMTGSFAQTTCQYQANYGSGCISQAAQGSAGAGFNSAGGGVFALEFATWGINGWFIPRSSVPSSLTSGMSSLDTSTLGEPSVSYSGSTCDVATFFGSQQITIDTTLCGDDAGQNLGSSCAVPSGQTCYSYWVAGNPSTYDEAYWAINYLDIFGDSSLASSSPSGAGASSSSSSSSSSGSSASSSASGSGSGTATSTSTAAAGSATSGNKTSGAAKSIGGGGAASVAVVAVMVASSSVWLAVSGLF